MLCLLAATPRAVFAADTAPFKAAVVQFNPILNDRDGNIAAMTAVFEEALKNGAKLLVAPEMSTTGYHYRDRKAIAPFVDTIPGKATNAFAKLAARYDAYIVFGMPEVDAKTGLYHNSSAMVGPEGVVGSYRKAHQWETEEHWSVHGDRGVPVYDTKLGRIAINICMDSAYFESARLAAVGGADILAFPTNSTAQALAALPGRAMQNGLYVLSANRSNTESGYHMIGASAIWSPEGECLVSTPVGMTSSEDVNEPVIAYAEIDPAEYANRGKDTLKNRRPALYKDLMLRIAPWNYAKTTEPKELCAIVVQCRPATGGRDDRAKRIRALIDAELAAADVSPDLVVLPEMALSGQAQRESASDADLYADLARSYRTYLVGSFVERLDGSLHIAAALFDRGGKEVGRYRKTHLNDEERRWAKPGGEIGVFKTDIGRVALMIGDEVRYPEIAGLFSVHRADIIAVPSSWKASDGGRMSLPKEMSAKRYPDGGMILWDSIAMSAQAYTLVANYAGEESFGGSGIYALDPLYGLDQPAFLEKTEQALAVNFRTVQPEWWFNQEMLINSRREQHYMPLIVE